MIADDPEAQLAIAEGRTALGIELGSTRIKAVLIGAEHEPLAVGAHSWENQFVDRRWTYSLDSVWAGAQDCFASLVADVRQRYGVELTTVGAVGVSAMMHGYLAFDATGELLTPFRTWRNTTTGPAALRLSALFDYNIPQRWSIAHLYQAVLDNEDHVGRIAHLTTLAGYVHWQLTGEQVLGVGDASGMFPIDTRTGRYDAGMVGKFDDLVAGQGLPPLTDLLPAIRRAGDSAGTLTATGARLLDPTGAFRPGAPVCPPEGDAGTGMVATNSVAPRTGNVSAGTSIFAMVVLEHELSRVHHQLDLVTTPAGDLVAMVHCNNGASELDAWAGLFAEFAAAAGADLDTSTVFETLFRSALDGAPDGGGLMVFNYLAGEPITGLDEGRPLFLRTPDSTLNLATFIRTQLYAAFGTLRIGMDVLTKDEKVQLDTMFAHGGLFTTKGVAQRFLAAAIDTPVAVGETAAEGGAWGIAVLAAFLTHRTPGQSLADYLTTRVFADAELDEVKPDPVDVAGFDAFMQRYVQALPVQQAAVEHTLKGGHPVTITADIRSTMTDLRATVSALHAELPRNELVIWTAGNVSARVPGHELLVIKPSGVSYDDLTADSMVVTDFDGTLVEGDRAPSSDTAAHAYVYRHMPDVGGVVHTHSRYATAWAAIGEPIPCVLTMIADEFGGEIPIGPFALIGDDSIGRGIVDTLRGHRSRAVLMRSHGPFTIGRDARDAVKAAVMVEDVARAVFIARQLGTPTPLAQADIDALFDRYQNVYGQQPDAIST